MRLEVLGLRVGSPLGAPCPSYVVSSDGAGTLLLDCGPGALDALWRSGLIARLDAIVISHMHLDHMLDLLPFSNSVTLEALRERFGVELQLPLHVPRGGRDVLRALLEPLGSDPDRLDDGFAVHEYGVGDTVEAAGFSLTFTETRHTRTCFAPRVSDGSKTLVYGADGAYTDALVRHAAGADLALLEATYLDPGPELAEYGHMTGEQAAEVAAQAGVRRLVLTHVMPFEEENAENLRRARARFDGPVDLAEPGAVFEV
jgi:ribonuclease BN (tRNA processing enzyme)